MCRNAWRWRRQYWFLGNFDKAEDPQGYEYFLIIYDFEASNSPKLQPHASRSSQPQSDTWGFCQYLVNRPDLSSKYPVHPHTLHFLTHQKSGNSPNKTTEFVKKLRASWTLWMPGNIRSRIVFFHCAIKNTKIKIYRTIILSLVWNGF